MGSHIVLGAQTTLTRCNIGSYLMVWLLTSGIVRAIEFIDSDSQALCRVRSGPPVCCYTDSTRSVIERARIESRKSNVGHSPGSTHFVEGPHLDGVVDRPGGLAGLAVCVGAEVSGWGLVERPGLRAWVPGPGVRGVCGLALAEAMAQERSQAEQFRAVGDGRSDRAAFRRIAGGGTIHQPGFAAGIARRNHFVFGWMASAASGFFPACFSAVDDSHSGDHLQSDYVSAAIDCLALRNFLAGIGAGPGVA